MLLRDNHDLFWSSEANRYTCDPNNDPGDQNSVDSAALLLQYDATTHMDKLVLVSTLLLPLAAS